MQAQSKMTVISKIKTGSDHRLLRCRVSFNTRLERMKLIKSNRVNINLAALRSNRKEFELKLENRFQILESSCNDIDSYNNGILTAITEESKSITGLTKGNDSKSKISEETKALLKKRREMKGNHQKYGKIEYVELCKTIRKKMSERTSNINSNHRW